MRRVSSGFLSPSLCPIVAYSLTCTGLGLPGHMAVSPSFRMPGPKIFKVHFGTHSLSERCFSDCSEQEVERVGSYSILRR